MASTSTQAIMLRSKTRTVSPWLHFAVRRGGMLLLSLWVLVTAAFLMIHLVPGDPVRAALGLTAPAELVEARREALGLNDPLWLQYVHYIQGLFTGNMGVSMISGQPVTEIIGTRFPGTLLIAVLAVAVVVIVAVPLGVTMAVLTRNGRRRALELTYASVSVIIAAFPEFLLAVGLVFIFAVTLQWLPVAGFDGPASLVLPVAALAIGPIAVFARIVRVEVLGVLGTDFVRTARAKRLTPPRIYARHALPNAMTASLTLIGLMLSGMVAGTVLVENVFAFPGLGTTIVQSILQKDYAVVQAIVLVYGVGVLLVNVLVDVALALIDPRSTIQEA